MQNEEDPEKETRDKEPQITVSCLKPYRKRIRFYFWPCFLLFLLSVSPPSSACNGAFTHLYTHRPYIVWAHVCTYRSHVFTRFTTVWPRHSMLYVPVRYFWYIHKVYVQLGEWRATSVASVSMAASRGGSETRLRWKISSHRIYIRARITHTCTCMCTHVLHSFIRRHCE